MKNLTIITDDRRLLKWLRFAGISSELFMPENPGSFSDNDIWYAFRSPGRFLTFPSDYKIYTGYFDLEKQIDILRQYFQIDHYINIMSRCSVCNHSLKQVQKEDVLEYLPPKVQKYCTAFYQCTHCGKLYWNGTHYQKIMKKLQEVFK